MNKKLYIIPGWTETCRRKPYQSLAKIAIEKGYEVIPVKVDWKKNLSSQVFSVPENSIIFGFSLGAVLARLVAQDNLCEHLISASMSPLRCFIKDDKDRKDYVDLLGSEYIDDIEKSLKPTHQAHKQTIIYGDKEGEKGDILVLNTGHDLNDRYIEEIGKLL